MMNKVYNHRVDSITIHLHRMLEFLQPDEKLKYDALTSPTLRAFARNHRIPESALNRYETQSSQRGVVYSGVIARDNDTDSLLVSQRQELYRITGKRNPAVHSYSLVLDMKNDRPLVQSVGERSARSHPPHGYTFHRDFLRSGVSSEELVYQFDPKQPTGRIFCGENPHATALSMNPYGAFIDYVGGCEEIPWGDALSYIGARRIDFRRNPQGAAVTIFDAQGDYQREIALGSRIDPTHLLRSVLVQGTPLTKNYVHSRDSHGQPLPS